MFVPGTPPIHTLYYLDDIDDDDAFNLTSGVVDSLSLTFRNYQRRLIRLRQSFPHQLFPPPNLGLGYQSSNYPEETVGSQTLVGISWISLILADGGHHNRRQ